MHTEELSTAVIESLAYRGLGVARVHGKVVFLPFTAPGDTVRFEVRKEFPRHALGIARELLQEGSGRTAPFCPFFERCGGCHLQHLVYEEQLRWKERWVRDALFRIGGIAETGDTVHDIVGSPRPLGYRNKASLHVRDGAIGFLAQATDEVIDIDACPILLPAVEKVLPLLRSWIVAHTHAKATKAPFRIVVRVGDDDRGVVVLHTGLLPRGSLAELSKALPEFRIGRGRSSDTVEYRVGAITFQVGMGAFFQVNSLLHGKMTELVQHLAGRGRHLVDAHAGVGWPSLCLADRFDRVSAVEISRQAASLGRKNTSAAEISNVAYFGGTVYSVQKGGMLESRPDVVLLDPPRSGLRVQDLDSVARLEPERIVYISCDPATLARDIGRFVQRGFHLASVHPIDLFPQTYHVETIALLHHH